MRGSGLAGDPILVLPVAGRGSRLTGSSLFRGERPVLKPLVGICGRPMIWWALRSFAGVRLSKIVFVILQEHEREFSLGLALKEVVASLIGEGVLCPCPVEIQVQRQSLNGQLLSVLEAKHHFSTGTGVLIASCDTLVLSDLGEEIARLPATVSGLISVV